LRKYTLLPQDVVIGDTVAQEEYDSDAAGTSPSAPRPTSVIIPALNEAENIAQLLLRLDQTMKLAGIPYEAIVVDDRSTDATAAVVEATALDHNLPVRVLTKEGVPGKAYALREGFVAARFDVLAMIDGDLQYPPEALATMNRQLGHADLVVADRRKSYSHANRMRGQLSRIFTLLVTMLFGIDTDMQSGMKMFRRKVYNGLEVHRGGWSFDLYLVTHAVSKKYKLVNVPIEFKERQSGVSKVSPLKVALELLLAALQIKLVWLTHSLKSLLFRTQGAGVHSEQAPEKRDVSLLPKAEESAQIERYTAWLEAEEKYNNTVSYYREETSEYVDAAMQTVMVKNRAVKIYAPFKQELSSIRTFTFGQTIFFLFLISLCVFGLIVFKENMVVWLLAATTAFYLLDLFMTLILSFLSFKAIGQVSEEKIDNDVVQALADVDWPRYTVLCPLYHEAAVVPQFIQAMQALDYPTDKLQILFLTEEHDVETREALRAIHLPGHFKIVTVPPGEPRTKPRACNFGLLRATGDYIVIYDAEDIPEPSQLKKAVLAFANNDADLACIQAKLNFYNSEQNLLTRLFTAEYATWFHLTLPGLQKARLALPLGGTSNHFRTEILGVLGAWDAFNVTEDCDLGLRLSRYGLKTAILDSTTYEEANSQLKNWFRQRSRWIKGYMQTYLVHMRRPLRYMRPSRLRDFFTLQFIIGGKAAVLLINPFMWVLLIAYLFFRPVLNPVYHTLFPVSVLYMGSLCLIFGNFLYLYLHLAGCLKCGQYKLIKWTLLIPFYWMLSSVAAYIALFQLIVKPHYWEKTIHGLHLTKGSRSNQFVLEQYDTEVMHALNNTQETVA